MKVGVGEVQRLRLAMPCSGRQGAAAAKVQRLRLGLKLVQASMSPAACTLIWSQPSLMRSAQEITVSCSTPSS